VKEYGNIKFAYSRATYPAAIRAYEKELAATKISVMPYSRPTRKTSHQGIRVSDQFYIEFERIEL
jgi:hypothetical protein